MSQRDKKVTLPDLLQKYRQVLLYGIFGFATFLVSMATYALSYRVLGLNVLVANVISWVCAVLFAFCLIAVARTQLIMFMK